MSTRNRRLASSSSSSTAKKPSITGNQSKKMGAAKTQFSKKRVALSDITNQRNGFPSGSRAMVTHSKPMVPCTSKVAKKKETPTLPTTPSLESFDGVSCINTICTRDDHPTTKVSALPLQSSMDISPCRSPCASVSLDETMSTCDSLESPKFEYLENEDVSAIESIETKANDNLYISELTQKEGKISKTNIHLEMGPMMMLLLLMCLPQIHSFFHPVFMSFIRIRVHLRPKKGFLQTSWIWSRKILMPTCELFSLIGWWRQQLQLLGVACMMIASKYEEVSAPQVEEFCYVTDNTYCKDEILQMESSVLNYLKFEMTVPTTKFFLRFNCCSLNVWPTTLQSYHFLNTLCFTMLHL
ncbi:hypothetical protein ES332_D06G059500v1 [Gossypium tomentosum]|uniref:Cyclin-like domain-containing protein n=1 Tax=Gossypium tomentosum TaxID=34277 RepID=A0A5D2KEG6_GOSTO|nr:hypothetical protein ES332_D06G059500v1 [Gossypium tomentosum]